MENELILQVISCIAYKHDKFKTYLNFPTMCIPQFESLRTI
jgi:hypothetical protein